MHSHMGLTTLHSYVICAPRVSQKVLYAQLYDILLIPVSYAVSVLLCMLYFDPDSYWINLNLIY